MEAPNVKNLKIDEMLTRSEVTTGVLRVVYSLQNVEDYTKAEAAQELIKLLNDMGYLEDPLKTEWGVNHGS